MSLKIGIIGLPNAGKSTLFKAITRKEALIAPYPFTTIEPNVGVVEVFDERLLCIKELIKPRETIPATLEFVDIAGLIEGAHTGEGLGNQFLSHISECDALVQVINDFDNGDPEKDKEIVRNELRHKDLQVTEKLMEKEKKKGGVGGKRWKELQKIKEVLESGGTMPDRELRPLSAKPVLFLYNGAKEREGGITLDLRTEQEIVDLDPEEREELGVSSSLDRLIKECYNLVDLITFFTIAGGEKAQAWSLQRDENILRAAEKVHSDFKEKFIRAEVISFSRFQELGSIQRAKEKGEVRTAGKDYLVQDGDIIEFKI